MGYLIMGDIADQIINGECCEICLCPADSPVGVSFTCSECEGQDVKDLLVMSEKVVKLSPLKHRCCPN